MAVWILLAVALMGCAAVLAIGACLSNGNRNYRPRHLAAVPDLDLTDIGSMLPDEDPHADTIVAKVERWGDISGPPGGLTWDELMRAELSPEALDPLPAPLPDPGPGGALVSSSPPPGPDQCSDWLAGQLDVLRAWSEWQQQKGMILA